MIITINTNSGRIDYDRQPTAKELVDGANMYNLFASEKVNEWEEFKKDYLTAIKNEQQSS